MEKTITEENEKLNSDIGWEKKRNSRLKSEVEMLGGASQKETVGTVELLTYYDSESGEAQYNISFLDTESGEPVGWYRLSNDPEKTKDLFASSISVFVSAVGFSPVHAHIIKTLKLFSISIIAGKNIKIKPVPINTPYAREMAIGFKNCA